MKSLVLTFDDGPDNRYTPLLLDLLKHENVTATFFVVGCHAAAHPELIHRMISEGHTVGGHTMRHQNALLCTPSAIRDDFKVSIRLHRELTGTALRFFRPPWGISSPFMNRYIKKHQILRVLWDVMAEDWKPQTTSDIISAKLKDRVFDGAVICLHDAGEDTGGAKGAPRRTIDALIHTIPWLKAQGYQFLTMEQYIKGVDAHVIQQRKKSLLWP